MKVLILLCLIVTSVDAWERKKKDQEENIGEYSELLELKDSLKEKINNLESNIKETNKDLDRFEKVMEKYRKLREEENSQD